MANVLVMRMIDRRKKERTRTGEKIKNNKNDNKNRNDKTMRWRTRKYQEENGIEHEIRWVEQGRGWEVMAQEVDGQSYRGCFATPQHECTRPTDGPTDRDTQTRKNEINTETKLMAALLFSLQDCPTLIPSAAKHNIPPRACTRM